MDTFCKRQFWIRVGISVAMMFFLPFLVAEFSPSCAGMALCLVLFLIVNPLYSIFLGFVSGKNVIEMWSVPLISSVAFLLGAWCFFDIREMWFLAYAGFYLLLGYLAMGFRVFISKRNV